MIDGAILNPHINDSYQNGSAEHSDDDDEQVDEVQIAKNTSDSTSLLMSLLRR